MSHHKRFLAYLQAYAAKDLGAIETLLADDVSLRDWKIHVRGKAAALAETQANFKAAGSLQIEPLRVYASGDTVLGELCITVDYATKLFVVDVLDFNAAGQICAIRAFLGRGDDPV